MTINLIVDHTTLFIIHSFSFISDNSGPSKNLSKNYKLDVRIDLSKGKMQFIANKKQK